MIKKSSYKCEIGAPLTPERKDAYWQEYTPDDEEIIINIRANVDLEYDGGDISDIKLLEYFEILPDGTEVELTDTLTHDLIMSEIGGDFGEWS